MTLASIVGGFLDAAGILVIWCCLGLVFWALYCAIQSTEHDTAGSSQDTHTNTEQT